MTTTMFPEGTALVIGGSGGMGADICKTLAANGSDIALTWRSNQARADEVVNEIQALGRRASAHQVNIADETSVAAAVAAVAANGRVHTVVMASGSDIKQPLIRDLSTAHWRAVVEADLNGFYHVLHHTLPVLKSGGGGSYVHLSSAGTRRWPHGDVLSVAPKACIDSLLLGVAREEGKHGIRANTIGVGVIETGIFLRLRSEGVFDENWERAVLKTQCVQRFGQSQEIANAVLFLATAGFVTGQSIMVDGGYSV